MYQSGGQLRGRPEESPRPLNSLLCRLGNWLRDASPPPRPLVATSRQGLGPKFDSDLWVTLVEVGSSPWDISSTYFGGRSSKISFCQSSKDGNPVLQYVNLSQPRFTTVSFFAQKSDYRALIKRSVYTCPRGSPSPLFCNHWSGHKNTGEDCHFLLQRIFLNPGSNPCLLHFLHWQATSLPLSHLGNPK